MQICERVHLEAGPSARVQSDNQTELNHVGREGSEEKREQIEPGTAASRPKDQNEGEVTQMSGLYREELLREGQPIPGLAGKFMVEIGVGPPETHCPITSRDRGMMGEAGCMVQI